MRSSTVQALSQATHVDLASCYRYGGHYGPVFNEYIVEQNAAIDAGNLPGAHKIALETVMIGNGWYDPLLQYGGYYNYTLDNTYDVSFKKEWQYDEMFNAMYGEGNCEYIHWRRGVKVLTFLQARI